MNDADKTKAQLLAELTMLRQRNVVLEATAQEQRQMAEDLRESEERHRILVERSLQGISVFDLEGTRLFANQALATMLGYEHLEPLIGKRADAHLSSHEAERLEGYRRTRLEGKPVPLQYEVEGVRRDGSTIWMEQLVSPITWQNEPALLIATLDIYNVPRNLDIELR